MMKDAAPLDKTAIPEEIVPAGMDDQCRRYLFAHVRKYVNDPWEDITIMSGASTGGVLVKYRELSGDQS